MFDIDKGQTFPGGGFGGSSIRRLAGMLNAPEEDDTPQGDSASIC